MNFYDNKKRPSVEEMASDGLPRKKFISEENFARDMAAMTLESTNNKNVVRINNIDQFLAEDEFMQTDTMQNGLPLQWKPGDKKPRIPDFVLNQTEFTDPRDKVAFEKCLKSTKHIEIINNPISSMDLD